MRPTKSLDKISYSKVQTQIDKILKVRVLLSLVGNPTPYLQIVFFFLSHRWFLVNQYFIIERLSNSIGSQPLYHCSAVVHSFETVQLARTRYLVHLTPNINGPLYIN